jgi:hypothetical protein
MPMSCRGSGVCRAESQEYVFVFLHIYYFEGQRLTWLGTWQTAGQMVAELRMQGRVSRCSFLAMVTSSLGLDDSAIMSDTSWPVCLLLLAPCDMAAAT